MAQRRGDQRWREDACLDAAKHRPTARSDLRRAGAANETRITLTMLRCIIDVCWAGGVPRQSIARSISHQLRATARMLFIRYLFCVRLLRAHAGAEIHNYASLFNPRKLVIEGGGNPVPEQVAERRLTSGPSSTKCALRGGEAGCYYRQGFLEAVDIRTLLPKVYGCLFV